jgi:hypothetical protein
LSSLGRVNALDWPLIEPGAFSGPDERRARPAQLVERAAAASAVEAFASLPGAGATARVGDRELLGSPALMASRGVDVTGSAGAAGWPR